MQHLLPDNRFLFTKVSPKICLSSIHLLLHNEWVKKWMTWPTFDSMRTLVRYYIGDWLWQHKRALLEISCSNFLIACITFSVHPLASIFNLYLVPSLRSCSAGSDCHEKCSAQNPTTTTTSYTLVKRIRAFTGKNELYKSDLMLLLLLLLLLLL